MSAEEGITDNERWNRLIDLLAESEIKNEEISISEEWLSESIFSDTGQIDPELVRDFKDFKSKLASFQNLADKFRSYSENREVS